MGTRTVCAHGGIHNSWVVASLVPINASNTGHMFIDECGGETCRLHYLLVCGIDSGRMPRCLGFICAPPPSGKASLRTPRLCLHAHGYAYAFLEKWLISKRQHELKGRH